MRIYLKKLIFKIKKILKNLTTNKQIKISFELHHISELNPVGIKIKTLRENQFNYNI